MSEELVCITCPLGCRLSITRRPEGPLGQGTLAVGGNRCPRGVKYAEEELLAPKRMVSATARIVNPARDATGPRSGGLGEISRLPVRSTGAYAKESVPELLAAIYALNVSLPVRRGDVLIRDFKGSGIDVIATRTITESA